MSRSRSVLLLLFAAAFCGYCLAQDGVERPPNWLRNYGFNFIPEPYLHHLFDHYSQTDVDNLQVKLGMLRNTKFVGKWEGRYWPGEFGETHISHLAVSFESGYANFTVDTCMPSLHHLDYGRAIETADTVKLVPDVPAGSPRTAKAITYVKVRWGARRYLVEEVGLEQFAQRVVGIYVLPEEGDQETQVWVSGDPESTPVGLPKFPARFGHLPYRPIQTRITKLVSRKIEAEVSTGTTFYNADSAVYRVRMGAGSFHGVKKNMVFELPGTYDELTVTDVGPHSSYGLIVRPINDRTLADHCLTDEAKRIPCPKIRSGHRLTTKIAP